METLRNLSDRELFNWYWALDESKHRAYVASVKVRGNDRQHFFSDHQWAEACKYGGLQQRVADELIRRHRTNRRVVTNA